MFIDFHSRQRRLAALACGVALLALSGGGAFAAGAMTTGAIKLLDGPLKGAASVATVPAGVRVGVLWCGTRDQLCLVSFHSKAGFTGLDNLQLLDGQSSFGGPISSKGADGVRSTGVGGRPDRSREATGFDSNSTGGKSAAMAPPNAPDSSGNGSAPPKSTTSTTGGGGGGGVITRPIVAFH